MFSSLLQQKEDPYLSEAEKLVNKILYESAKSIEKKYNLYPCGDGAAMPDDIVKILILSFDTKVQYTKEKLRELLLLCSKDLLDNINKNEQLQEYLIQSPATIENVRIAIFNQDINGQVGFDPLIATAQISNGILIYRTKDPNDNFKIKNQFEESYAEAIKASGIKQ